MEKNRQTDWKVYLLEIPALPWTSTFPKRATTFVDESLFPLDVKWKEIGRHSYLRFLSSYQWIPLSVGKETGGKKKQNPMQFIKSVYNTRKL